MCMSTLCISNLLFNCQDSIKSPEIQPYGGVAQLGEHLPCKQGVKGSNPFISTTPNIHLGS